MLQHDVFQFLLHLLDGVGCRYDMKADPTKTQINFISAALAKYQHLLEIVEPDGCVVWCGYEVYPKTLRVLNYFVLSEHIKI